MLAHSRNGLKTSMYYFNGPKKHLAHMQFYYIIEPGLENTCLSYANNKGVDQPAHPRSLISAIAVRCLDSITHILRGLPHEVRRQSLK